jgi:hypothetical protein
MEKVEIKIRILNPKDFISFSSKSTFVININTRKVLKLWLRWFTIDGMLKTLSWNS